MYCSAKMYCTYGKLMRKYCTFVHHIFYVHVHVYNYT